MSVSQDIAEPAPLATLAAGGGGFQEGWRCVAANASWLALNQALSYALPLLSTPILTRGLGSQTYGVYSTALAYGAYAALLVTYGFNYYGPRAVALCRGDTEKLQRLYSAILTVQSGLALAALGLACVCLAAADIRGTAFAVYAALIAQAAITAATPLWLFVGLQDLRRVSLAQVIARLAVFAFILAIVRRPADLLPLSAATLLITGSVLAYTLREARRAVGGVLSLCTSAAGDVLAGAAPFFWSSLAVSLYASSGVIVANAVLGAGAAGHFALADKLRIAAVSLTGPVTQAAYPLFNQLAQAKTRGDDDVRLRRMFVGVMLALSGTSSLAMFCFAADIIRLLGGHDFGPASELLRIMSPAPLVIGASNILGRQTLIPWGHIRLFTAITVAAAVVGLLSIVSSLWLFGLAGAAWSGVAVESFVALAMAVAVARKGLLRHAFALA